MVYKPKKKVNGHKRNDRASRYRKRVRARKAARARMPVRSNIKRYVAQQLDKIAPDNRYYFNVTEEAADKIQPTCQLDVTNRIYPFGASFQKRFLNMEFRRMKEVIAQGHAQFPQLGATEDQFGATNAHDYNYLGTGLPNLDAARLWFKSRMGNFNHWRSVIGRGIHMKSSSVYGTITAFPNVSLTAEDIDHLRTADLTLHMFVLEDKAVTKTNFMDWYTNLLGKKEADNTYSSETSTRSLADTWRGDTIHVPYCAGSAYMTNSGSTATNKYVASETEAASPYGPKSDGTDEFLIDWRQFYKHDSTNPEHEVFHNTRPCTTPWDGSYDHSVLPINKSRFIVHEHKKWTIKPDSNGNIKQCIPWSYSFPEHYMTYEKELLDLPFHYAKKPPASTTEATDAQGIQAGLLFPRKQPFIVFCWSRCSNEGPLHVPNTKDVDAIDGDPDADPPVVAHPASKESGFTNVNHDDVFHIEMNMKCHYENALATKNVPTIHRGKPLVHKRESSLASKSKRNPKRRAPFGRVSLKKYTQPTLKDHFKVRRDAGTSSSKALSAQREAVIAKGKEIRAAMRRKEQEDHNATLADQGLSRAEFNDMAVEAMNEVDDAGKDAFDMMMGAMFPYQGEGRFRSGLANTAFRSILNAKVRAYISRKLSAAGLTADYMSIKQAAKAFYRYHQKLENDRARAWKTTHPQGRHTRLPEYIRD